MTIDRRSLFALAPLALVPFTPAQAATPGLKLVLHETFDRPLDKKKWNVRDSGTFMQTGKTGPGPKNWPTTSRGSTSVDQASNLEISGGTAKLWLRKAKTPRRSPYRSDWSAGMVFDHTSAYIDTVGKVEVKYGRWEMRCKIPAGPKRAVWGGMWLISNNDNKYLEVDVNEFFGHKEKTHANYPNAPQSHNRAQVSVHFDHTGKGKLAKFSPMGTDNFENEWHTWAVEILPKSGITFFMDGKAYYNVPANEPHLAARMAENFAFNMRINVMTGNYWNTTDSDEERARPFEIDYVKVYKYGA